MNFNVENRRDFVCSDIQGQFFLLLLMTTRRGIFTPLDLLLNGFTGCWIAVEFLASVAALFRCFSIRSIRQRFPTLTPWKEVFVSSVSQLKPSTPSRVSLLAWVLLWALFLLPRRFLFSSIWQRLLTSTPRDDAIFSSVWQPTSASFIGIVSSFRASFSFVFWSSSLWLAPNDSTPSSSFCSSVSSCWKSSRILRIW